MTVSDNAKIHEFLYSIAFAILFCLILLQPRLAMAQFTSDWQVSRVGALRYTIINDVIHAPTNQRITLYAIVSQVDGWPYFNGQGPRAILKLSSNRVAAGQQSQLIPSLGSGHETSVNFTVGPHSPGTYTYKICLSGLKRRDNWPAAELCGAGTKIVFGRSQTGTWEVGNHYLHARDDNSANPLLDCAKRCILVEFSRDKPDYDGSTPWR